MQGRTLVFAAAAFALLALGCEAEIFIKRAAPVVDLGYAKYEGSYNATGGFTRFLGIRYAAPPTGQLRWKEPQTPAHTTEILKADAFGNVCYYSGPGTASSTPFRNEKLVSREGNAWGSRQASEDCLFLNVWTPTDLDSRHPLPVVFYIHGGGYVLGDTTGYDGTNLLDISKNGVVVVTIQYRLGLFGFLSGAEVKKHGALNAGLLDQQFALLWVQKHIRQFGGDPDRVTIWGTSAGAGSVLQHVIANGGETKPQLFHNAITSSSFLPSQYTYDDGIPEMIFNETIEQTGCSNDPSPLNCLRQTDVSLLQSANVNISASGFYGTFVYVPVVDGDFIQQSPIEALKQHKVNGKAFLAVTNSDEGSTFVDPNTPVDVDVGNYIKELFPKFSDAEAKAAAAQYQGVGSQQSQPVTIMSETIFVCPTYYLLEAFDGKGFKGEFAIPPGTHGLDIQYYWPSFRDLLPPLDYTNAVFTKAFAQTFLDFAVSDDPNVKVDPDTITPEWKKWRGDVEMLFNRTESEEPDIRAIKTSTALQARCSCEAANLSKKTAPVVDLGYAKYEGSYNATSGVTRFLGIRYAAPPTGQLRWKEPQTPAYSAEIQKADAFGDVCYYTGFGIAPSTPFRNEKLVSRQTSAGGPGQVSEDCLFLNVWTPTDLSSRHPLPVVFWIHGGGYVEGDATGNDGTDLLDISKNGVVVVTIQYRLGIFGFLPGAEVKKHGALNAGLLDQQFALLWVRKHIHKFGGDPNHVTIWGESAGAGSVLQHVIANGGKTKPQLFHNAITSSTFLPSQYTYNDRVPELIFNETIEQTGCSNAPSPLNCLRQTDVSVLQSANLNISASGFYGTFVYVPVVDGDFIQQSPIEALKQHKVNGKAFLAVTNSDEGSVFVDPKTPVDVDVGNYIKELFPEISDAEAEAAAAQYQGVGSQQLQPVTIMSETIFVCPTYYLLEAFDGKGFKGEFAIPPGAHGLDIEYYWPSLQNLIPLLNYTNAVFTKAFAQTFLDFAVSDDPNVKVDPDTITPEWKKWGGDVEMLFNRTESGEPDIRAIKTSPALLARCRFWESVRDGTGQ